MATGVRHRRRFLLQPISGAIPPNNIWCGDVALANPMKLESVITFIDEIDCQEYTVSKAELFGAMKEGTTTTCVIQVDGMDAQVFKEMLGFIYGDSLPETEEENYALSKMGPTDLRGGHKLLGCGQDC
ncbi:TD and POZ domain-containing protein 4 [Hordeum vulgare]|nr:TD and POZ domain-containing protein 4 [Hordeum vulgare]